MKQFNLRSIISLTLSVIFLFAFQTFSYSGETVLPVEGIAYESKDPTQSIVVIDGNVYKKGEKYQTYEIMEVQQDRVVLKNAAGQVSEQRINGGNHPTEAKPASETHPLTKQVPRPGQETVPTQTKSPETFSDPLEKLKKMFAALDPTIILNYASEIAVMADLRNLYSVAAATAMEEGAEGKLDLDQLIKNGMANPALKEGKNGYRFRVEIKGAGVQVYADPIKADEKSRHFMIDAWGNMRAEQGAPATDKSPLMKPPAAVSELVPKTSQQQGGEENERLLEMPST